MTGTLMAGSALFSALESGKVFVPGTWSPTSVRGAAYDFRLSKDRLIVPAEPGRVARVYGPGELLNVDLILHPGDTAFVSSAERLCFDWDMAGIVGSKFRLSSKGLLLLSGISVDPGYGLELVGESWIAMADQRIHFLLANVGAWDIALRPGDPIAVLQLFQVPPVDAEFRREVVSPGLNAFNENYFDRFPGENAGLVFFRNVRDVADKATDALAEAAILRSRAESLLNEVKSVQEGSAFVVTFGIFLVAVTILGVCLTLILQADTEAPKTASMAWYVTLYVGGGTVGLIVVALLFLATRQLWKGSISKRQ